ncbi:hypothetical protein [Legionella qingyii]|uniref:hypothetical protein n=1 Tax=Legionella qingyii TaxID=2184757 RepID=UPI000F8DF05F|nr:hypothetical protein [Legionella qingyii]RUR21903.1 hypothetical protein ELY16_15750 [Legionella qingyii]
MLPGYIYGSIEDNSRLRQGDIILLKGELRKKFKKFFYGIVKPHQKRYILILSQCCDLYQDDARNCKIEHITVCVLSDFNRYLERLINECSLPLFNSRILSEDEYENLFMKLYKFINNSDPKNYFFLPKGNLFGDDKVAILSVNYPLRIDNYDLLLKNRIGTLSPEFKSKLGFVLGKLYSRAATRDLNDEKDLVKSFIENKLAELSVHRVMTPQHINKLKLISEESTESEVSELIDKVNIEILDQKISNDKKRLISYLNKFIFQYYEDVRDFYDSNEGACEGGSFRKKLREFLERRISISDLEKLFGDL